MKLSDIIKKGTTVPTNSDLRAEYGVGLRVDTGDTYVNRVGGIKRLGDAITSITDSMDGDTMVNTVTTKDNVETLINVKEGLLGVYDKNVTYTLNGTVLDITYNEDYSEKFKLIASDAQENACFGSSVAISEDRVVVGTYYEAAGGYMAGAAYIFDTNGNQLHKIMASDAEAYACFGYSIAISGDRIVVGAYYEDVGGPNAGAAYIFDTNGSQLHKIMASDAEVDDRFGCSVAISGDRIVVGAYREDAGGSRAGAAYIFDTDGNQLHKIMASDAGSDDNFGSAVAISGDRIVVGAYKEDTVGVNAGAAYIFDTNGNQLHKIMASDTQAGGHFGRAITISGDRIVAGAHGGSNEGAAYIFDTNGNQLHKIMASDAQASDYFGGSVTISGDRIAIGAYGEDAGSFNAGAAYVYNTEV